MYGEYWGFNVLYSYAWYKEMAKFTIHPRSVARQILTHLEGIKPLSVKDEAAIIHSIESSNVPDATERMLASLARTTLNELLKDI